MLSIMLHKKTVLKANLRVLRCLTAQLKLTRNKIPIQKKHENSICAVQKRE